MLLSILQHAGHAYTKQNSSLPYYVKTLSITILQKQITLNTCYRVHVMSVAKRILCALTVLQVLNWQVDTIIRITFKVIMNNSRGIPIGHNYNDGEIRRNYFLFRLIFLPFLFLLHDNDFLLIFQCKIYIITVQTC
jgi:hypothetical protein